MFTILDYVLGHPTVFAGIVSALTLGVTLAIHYGYRYLAAPEPDKHRADRLEEKVVDLEARLAHAQHETGRHFDEHLQTLDMLGAERRLNDELSAKYDRVAGELSTADNRYHELFEECRVLYAKLEAQAIQNQERGLQVGLASALDAVAHRKDREALEGELREAIEGHELFVSEMERQAAEWGLAVRVRDEKLESVCDSLKFVEGVAQEMAERVDELEKALAQAKDENKGLGRIIEEQRAQDPVLQALIASPRWTEGHAGSWTLDTTGSGYTRPSVTWNAGLGAAAG